GRNCQKPHPLLHARRLGLPLARPSRASAPKSPRTRLIERASESVLARWHAGPGRHAETVGNHWRSRENECVNVRGPARRRSAAGGVIPSANPPRTARASCCVKNERPRRFGRTGLVPLSSGQGNPAKSRPLLAGISPGAVSRTSRRAKL